jgi:hypothetical protein
MRHKIKPATFLNNVRNISIRAAKDTIIPFIEKPSLEKSIDSVSMINANDLFSMFTADIIKEKIVFTR